MDRQSDHLLARLRARFRRLAQGLVVAYVDVSHRVLAVVVEGEGEHVGGTGSPQVAFMESGDLRVAQVGDGEVGAGDPFPASRLPERAIHRLRRDGGAARGGQMDRDQRGAPSAGGESVGGESVGGESVGGESAGDDAAGGDADSSSVSQRVSG